MKKITVDTLSRISFLLPGLSDAEQLDILGGTGSPDSGITGAYTFNDMLDMIGHGGWSGGEVEGIGYVGSEASTYQTGCYAYEMMLQKMYYGTWTGGWVDHEYVGEDVLLSGYYSLSDMEQMRNDGTWKGGWVEGSGYVCGYTTAYTYEEMVNQMFRNEWHGGWVDGDYLDADYVVTGMYRTTEEVLKMMCQGNWYGGWVENSGYVYNDITGFAGNIVYSYSEMAEMERVGSWHGGWVRGIGYMTGVVSGDDFNDDGITGAVTGAHFSYEEMTLMADEGNWDGGMVDGIGYVEMVEPVDFGDLFSFSGMLEGDGDLTKMMILMAASLHRLDSNFEKELFENYWDAQGDIELSEERFKDITDYVKSQNLSFDMDEDDTAIIDGEMYTKKIVNFYNSEEYDYAFGLGVMYFDTETDEPVGFFDVYDFNSQPNGGRDNVTEKATRIVGKLGEEHGAKAYKITYGKYEE